MLAAGASPNQPNPGSVSREGLLHQKETPLLAAARGQWSEDGEARLAVLRLLLEAGGDPNYTLLENEIRNGTNSLGAPIHFTILGWWSEYWKDPRRTRKERQVDARTLRLAEVNNTFVERAVRLLLDAGADPNLARPDDGDTPLHLAARKGSVPLTKLLLERGADVRKPDGGGFTAVTDAVLWGDNPELVSFYESYLDANHITIEDVRWRSRRVDSFSRSFVEVLRFVGYLSLPLAYAAGAIYLREDYYRDHPQDNWLATGHAYLLGAGGSMFLAGLAGGYLLSRNSSGWEGLGRAVGGFLLGALVVGLPAGILATHYGHLPHSFKEYRALYYLPPAGALVATMVALTVDF